MADKLVITENDIDRELDALLEVSATKRKELNKKLKAAKEQGRGWSGNFGRGTGYVAVNPDGEVKDFHQLQFDNDKGKSRDAAICWAKGEEKYPCEEETGAEETGAEETGAEETGAGAEETGAEETGAGAEEAPEVEVPAGASSKPDLEIYDWPTDSAAGAAIYTASGWEYKGSALPNDDWAKSFGPVSSAFFNMYIWSHMANAALRPGKTAPRIGLEEEERPLSVREEDIDRELDLLLMEAPIGFGRRQPTGAPEEVPSVDTGVTVDELYKSVLKSIEKELDDLFTTLVYFWKVIPSEGEEESPSQLEIVKTVKEKFEKLNQRLTIQKKELEESPESAEIFNTINEKYFDALKNEILKKLEAKAPEIATKLDLDGKPEEEEEGMDMLQEEKLVDITIDFSEIRSKQIDESWLVMFGGWVEWLLGRMFGTGKIPGKIVGSKSEIESFAAAMGSEKRYIETAKRYGLDHPVTYKNKARLDTASKGFEKETGIKWPFK